MFMTYLNVKIKLTEPSIQITIRFFIPCFMKEVLL